MKVLAAQLDLVTEKRGIFKFKPHHNSPVNFYEAMVLFESCNFESLGATAYVLHLEFADGGKTTQTYGSCLADAPSTLSNINASAYLAQTMEETEIKLA